MYPLHIREEQLKNEVAKDFFSDKSLDSTKILGNVDFCVSFRDKSLFESINFLFAEAKAGKRDYRESLTQLILTLGKNKTLEHTLPPTYLGAFDCEKIALLPYSSIASYLQNLFSKNDFNWRVTPSDYTSPQFKQVFDETKEILESHAIIFPFESSHTQNHNKDLKDFIKTNFTLSNDKTHKIAITKNNFTTIYQKWLTSVAPSISIDWENEKPDILSSDFYLADLLSENNNTKAILDSLRILLQSDSYKVKLDKRTNSTSFNFTEFGFNDGQRAHTQFWNVYERPPKEEYWGYIIERRDLLVPSDIRERKGAFFTPQIWVTKAQEYLAKTFGENYQEEYYIWDLAAGTGNLLANLTESHNIYASTLDKADVEIMHELAEKEALHLLPNHIFQFDFLNDELFDTPCARHKDSLDSKCKDCKESKLPKSLQHILKDSKKREKLIIYINPPYAEAGTTAQTAGTGSNKAKVATDNATYLRYKDSMGKASNELFAQFFFRIYNEIPHCTLASFSTLKYINSSNFIKFRETFKARFLGGFVCPAYTFDNVKGQFPIGFLVWNLNKNDKAMQKIITLDAYNEKNEYMGEKRFYLLKNTKTKRFNEYLQKFDDKQCQKLAILMADAPDFQNNNHVAIMTSKTKGHWIFKNITPNNLIPFSVYFSVRHAIKATWLNDRDQFLYPNSEWEKDSEFQNDCLAFTLFHGQNRITSRVDSTNGGGGQYKPLYSL
ncbi:hypothetical protein [Helicobacter pullorum]|uniref:hypothetical protein n=1 Tax=Helicobacter pullorum TaxID=35818 RepID=UPI002D799C99|nr:hypothetical protein [Helicobacter pullorum]